MSLTSKQQRFIDAYTGNATQAAIQAGYSKDTAYSSGQRLLKNSDVAAAIRAREAERQADIVATREERLKFYTQVMRNIEEDTKHRLKAAELLGKAEGDFLERVEAETPKHIVFTWKNSND